jgi:predicted DNA-binding ribbon-helix-helix protein
MKSSVIKRSIVIAGRRTSISVEDDFWNGLQDIAKARHETLSLLVARIDAERRHANLSFGHSVVCPWFLSEAINTITRLEQS